MHDNVGREKGSSRNLMEEQNKKVALAYIHSMPNMECTQQIDLRNNTCIEDLHHTQNTKTHTYI